MKELVCLVMILCMMLSVTAYAEEGTLEANAVDTANWVTRDLAAYGLTMKVPEDMEEVETNETFLMENKDAAVFIMQDAARDFDKSINVDVGHFKEIVDLGCLVWILLEVFSEALLSSEYHNGFSLVTPPVLEPAQYIINHFYLAGFPLGYQLVGIINDEYAICDALNPFVDILGKGLIVDRNNHSGR